MIEVPKYEVPAGAVPETAESHRDQPPGYWAVLFVRTMVKDPAGHDSPSPPLLFEEMYGYAVIAFAQLRALGIWNVIVFDAVPHGSQPRAPTLRRSRYRNRRNAHCRSGRTYSPAHSTDRFGKPIGYVIEPGNVAVWYSTGYRHVTRLEDFPVMSSESISFKITPRVYLDRNPALGAADQVMSE